VPDDTDQQPAPTVFILYGATGDLAKRMVLPAFAQLRQHGLLPEQWRLVGNGRGDISHEEFRGRVRQALAEFGPTLSDEEWGDLEPNLLFAGGGFTADDPGSMLDVLAEAEDALGATPQRVHYIALPPTTFRAYTEAIGRHGLAERARVVYEKPYGTSPEDFRTLDRAVHEVFDESAVFRIDHFLGKEATQDLHVLRFGNTVLGDGWDARHVESVQIDVPETLDVADRAEFYDATGATLDMLVTHLFQVAAEVAMEPPVDLSAESLQTAREAVISAFRPLDPADVVLGQYDGYRDLPEVADDSTTDTFVAARMWVDTDRWHGVPFLLRTGKCLRRSEQRVSLVFRRPEGPLRHVPVGGSVLGLSMKGDGQISLDLVVKEPGPTEELTSGRALLPLATVRGADPLPPYVRLLHDVLLGDRSLFTRPDGLAAAWEVLQPLLDGPPAVLAYPVGSDGPAAATALAGHSGWVLDRE